MGYLAHIPGLKELQGLELPSTSPISPVLKATEPIVLPDVEPQIIAEFLEEQPEPIQTGDYQEQNGASNQIRRRRRRRPGEDDLPPTTSNVVTTEKETEPTPTIKKEKDRTISLRSSRREETKIEKVSVEMTPLEQEVYALMGVSPLIRLDKPVSNPQGVIISIKVPEVTQTQETTELNLKPTEDTGEDSTESEIQATQTEATQTEATQTEESEASLIRRRRRRSSSALDN